MGVAVYLSMKVRPGKGGRPLSDNLESLFGDILDEAKDAIERDWRSRVDSQLNTTAKAYQEALTFERRGAQIRAMVGCPGERFCLPVAVETGQAAFDMKKTIRRAKRARVKQKKGGHKYKRIKVGDNIRTISEIAAPGAWQHPGIQARKIHQQVLDVVRKELAQDIYKKLLSRVTL